MLHLSKWLSLLQNQYPKFLNFPVECFYNTAEKQVSVVFHVDFVGQAPPPTFLLTPLVKNSLIAYY